MENNLKEIVNNLLSDKNLNEKIKEKIRSAMIENGENNKIR